MTVRKSTISKNTRLALLRDEKATKSTQSLYTETYSQKGDSPARRKTSGSPIRVDSPGRQYETENEEVLPLNNGFGFGGYPYGGLHGAGAYGHPFGGYGGFGYGGYGVHGSYSQMNALGRYGYGGGYYGRMGGFYGPGGYANHWNQRQGYLNHQGDLSLYRKNGGNLHAFK